MHVKQFHHNLQYMSPVGTGDFAVQLTKPLSRLSTAIFTMAPEIDPDSIANGAQYCNFFLGFRGNSEDFDYMVGNFVFHSIVYAPYWGHYER